jgi:hypothetical protein
MSSAIRENATDSEDGLVTNLKADPENVESVDVVSLEWSGSVLWAPPITASFSRGALSGYPCGSGHPSQIMDSNSYTSSAKEIDFLITDGEKFSTRCSLQLDTSMDSMNTEIVAVRFEVTMRCHIFFVFALFSHSVWLKSYLSSLFFFKDNESADNPVSTTLISNKATSMNDGDCIYKPRNEDPCRFLSTGSRLSVSYTILASLKDDTISNASTTLGSILVDWRPSILELPLEYSSVKDKQGVCKPHGPLALETPSTIRFTGPNCYIERAPFKAETLDLPSHVSVATPFDVQYSIENTTRSHQSVTIQMLEESASKDALSASTSGLMLSGCMNGQLSLGPLEKHTLSYRAIAFHPGEMHLPILRISSDRYKSWIVNERSVGKRVYVLP